MLIIYISTSQVRTIPEQSYFQTFNQGARPSFQLQSVYPFKVATILIVAISAYASISGNLIIEIIIFPKESMNQFKTLIQEDEYCHESDLLLCHYSRFQSSCFQAEIQFMNKWMTNDGRVPLVLAGDSQSGKISLISCFLRESQSRHAQWLHIAHFGSLTPVYSQILYKIMVELRNHFKIEQRVDLNEEKLRRYFKYWLQLTSDLIEKQFLGYDPQEVPKVVIVVEGIDECVDLRGVLVSPQFWLPQEIPKHIKLIISTKSMNEQLIKNGVVLRQHISEDKINKIIQKYDQKVIGVCKTKYELSVDELEILNEMVMVRPGFEPVSTDFKDILSQYIIDCQLSELSLDQIKSLLYVLSLTRKGLKFQSIQKVLNVTLEKWMLFYKHFSFFIVEHKHYFIICNNTCRQIISQLADPNAQKVTTYRQAIAHSIRIESQHLRDIQESVYQLFLSQNFVQLKEVISRVENFIILYTPLSKDLLCQCWVKLQQLQQYDPVFEYNRAIQAFASHYYPRQQELYRIIFQLCMFFKEYSQFQNAKTPEFRHPLIRGQIEQLQDMGMYDELKGLGMVGKCKSYKFKPLQKISAAKINRQVLKKKEEFTKKKLKLQRESVKSNRTDIQTINSGEVHSKHKDSEIIKNEIEFVAQSAEQKQKVFLDDSFANIEELNVSIATNQDKFRRFFTNSMKQYLENYFVPTKKIFTKGKQQSFESQQSDNEEESLKEKGEREFKFDSEKYKQSLVLKTFKEYLEQNYHKSGEEVSYYYYKQWLWLQFPWLCQTVKHVYSSMIKQNLPGSIHFMSPLTEFNLIREVLKITKNAKQTKMGILTDRKIEVLPLKYSSAKLQLQQIKHTAVKPVDNSVCYTKRTTLDERSSKIALSIGKIQEQIKKERQYYEQNLKIKNSQQSRMLKNQISLPNLNLFVTQHDKDSRLFPLLNKSRFYNQTTARKTQKQNSKDCRDFTMIIRKYNEITHENDMLVSKIEENKKTSLIQADRNKQQLNHLGINIKQLENKKIILQRNIKAQEDLQKKLQVIIQVCDLNKIYGSQSDYLSNYLGNLKQMIALQEQRVQKIKQKIVLSVENGKITIRDLRSKRKALKVTPQNIVLANRTGESTHLNGLSIPLEDIEVQLRQQIVRGTRIKSKNFKSKKQIVISSQDSVFLEENIGILYGSSQNDEKISAFADLIDKKKQLILKNVELTKDLAQKRQQIQLLRSEMKTFQQQKANEKLIKTNSNLVQRKKQLIEIKHRNELLLSAIGTLQKSKSD